MSDYEVKRKPGRPPRAPVLPVITFEDRPYPNCYAGPAVPLFGPDEPEPEPRHEAPEPAVPEPTTVKSDRIVSAFCLEKNGQLLYNIRVDTLRQGQIDVMSGEGAKKEPALLGLMMQFLEESLNLT
jgi:hypothetical protein